MARYGAPSVTLTPIRPGQGGASIFAARLGDKQYALRVSGPFLTERPDWVEFEGALLAQASAFGVPVAAALSGLDGRYGQRVEGGLACLTEWADGDVDWPAPPEKAYALGLAVARLHRSTERMDAPGAKRDFSAAGILDRPMELLGKIADTEPLVPFVEEMHERILAIRKDSETFGAIHGDVHQGNCHFDGDRAMLFDFAQCGIGWRAFDLAGFLWPWRDASIQKPELRAACDAYLAGYRSERGLRAEEERALPAFVRARDLWEAGEWVATGDAGEKPDEVRESIFALSERWLARPLPNSLDLP